MKQDVRSGRLVDQYFSTLQIVYYIYGVSNTQQLMLSGTLYANSVDRLNVRLHLAILH